VAAPQPLRAVAVARLDQREQLLVGLDRPPEALGGLGLVEVARHPQLGMGGDDVVEHGALQGERLVPRPLHDQLVEAVGEARPLARVGRQAVGVLDRGLDLGHHGGEVGDVLLGPAAGEHARADRLGYRPRLVHVVDGRALQLQQQADPAGGHRHVGRHHLGAAAAAGPHDDQPFRLQDAEGLADRRPGHAELLHELGLRRQLLPRLHRAADDLPAQLGGDQLGGLGRTDQLADLAAGHPPVIDGGHRVCGRVTFICITIEELIKLYNGGRVPRS
jgi:hypothetical protein